MKNYVASLPTDRKLPPTFPKTQAKESMESNLYSLNKI